VTPQEFDSSALAAGRKTARLVGPRRLECMCVVG
jgi:hypothetical protein